MHTTLRQFDTTLGFDKGGTPLHAAMGVCPPQHVDEVVAMLLQAGADPNRGSKSGVTPLHSGIAFHSLAGVNALIKHAEGKLRIDAGFKLNNATPLHVAVYLSTTEIVAVLIDAGAKVGHVCDSGSTELIGAVQNPACTLEMLELLHASNKVDVNRTYRPRTRKWFFILKIFETMYKSRLVSKTDLIMELAHSRGGTALHFAAQCGHVHTIEWLLEHGAHLSLHMRNKQGCTPIDVARIFGPFPEVEAILGSVILDGGFHERYVVRKGSLLRRRDVSMDFSASRGASQTDCVRDAGMLEADTAEAPIPAVQLAPSRVSEARVEPYLVSEEASRSGGGRAGGDDANCKGGERGFWSSITNVVAHTSPPRAADDASHVLDSVRLREMLESVVEAQTRALAQTTATLLADNASMRTELASLRADLNLSA